MDLPKFDLETFKSLSSRCADSAKMYANFPSEKNRIRMMEGNAALHGYMMRFHREIYKGWAVLTPRHLHETQSDAISYARGYVNQPIAVMEVEFYSGMGMEVDGDGVD